MTALQMPQRKLIQITIREISNGFIVTSDGEHTFVSSYEEALMSLPPPPTPKKGKK